MVDHPPPVAGGAAAEFDTRLGRARAEWDGLHPWPAPADLPVLVATRMSLSFPALIAAVPLAAAWFTDGGLCANLPVHFFDTALPRRPTFALNLGPFPPGKERTRTRAATAISRPATRPGSRRPGPRCRPLGSVPGRPP